MNLILDNRTLTFVQVAEESLRTMATTDFLTGAYNRRAFDEMGEREHERSRRYGKSVALLIVDIDHFKEFNDRYGHLGGDIMLREMVTTFRTNLRGVDVMARWGGEEFAMLLPETDSEGCLRVAEKIRSAVAKLSVLVDEQATKATISVGCTVSTPGDESLEAVLMRADKALYQAKQSGRNCVVIA